MVTPLPASILVPTNVVLSLEVDSNVSPALKLDVTALVEVLLFSPPLY